MAEGPQGAEPSAGAAAAFVGRALELEKVLATCRAAERGAEGSLTVVAGEAGIGKTRFCREVTARARDIGLPVVMVRCWDEGGSPPLWPWQPALAELCGPDADALLAADTELPGTDRDRFARFTAVADALEARCRRTPAVLIIDDVHAADPDTLLLTRFVARLLHRMPLALVLTRRADEPAVGTDEDRLLDEIAREAAAIIALDGFDATETAAFLAVHGLDDLDDEMPAILGRITDGNPLFLQRIVATASPTELIRDRPHAGLPRGVARGLEAAIGRTLHRLPVQARDILRSSAVLGSSPSVGAAATVAGADIAAVLTAVQEAAAAGLVTADRPHRFTFTHDLVRTALEESLPFTDRVDAHARAAAIGVDHRTDDPDRLTRRAHHALAAAPRSAGDAGLAVTACRDAARALIRSFAYEQADRLLTAAIELHETADLGPPAGDLLVEWAQAALLCGRLTDARTRFGRAAAVTDPADDPDTFAEASLGLGGYWLTELRSPVDRARITALQESALAHLPDDRRSLHARLTARLAGEAVYHGGPIQAVYDALDEARRCDDPVGLADSLSLCHHALLRPEHTHDRLALADELVRVGAEAGHGALALMGLCWRTVDLLHLGDPEAIRALEELRRRADGLHCQVVLYVVDLIDVTLQIRAGHLDRAEDMIEPCYRRGRAVGDADADAYRGGQIAAIRWLQGRSAELVELMDRITASPELRHTDFAYRAAGAVFAGDAGRPEHGRTVLDQLAADGLDNLPRSSTWLVGMMAIAELAAAHHDRDAARAVYDQLRPFAALPMVASLGVLCFGSTHRPLGLAARTFDDDERAITHFESAVAANLSLGNLPLAALSRAELAATLVATGDPERRTRAVDVLDEAIEQADTMGMTARADRWRSDLDRLRRTTGGADRSTGVAAGGPAAPRPNRRRGTIRREGRGWLVALDDRRVLVGDLVGMGYLAELLTRPGVPIPALDLAAGPGTVADTGPHHLLDRTARTGYEARARELAAELAEAEANADMGHVERLQAELDALVEEIRAGTGLGGRSRTFTGPAERARTAVRKAITRALDAIDDADNVIGARLRSAVATGTTCVYTPDPDDPVTWSAGAADL